MPLVTRASVQTSQSRHAVAPQPGRLVSVGPRTLLGTDQVRRSRATEMAALVLTAMQATVLKGIKEGAVRGNERSKPEPPCVTLALSSQFDAVLSVTFDAKGLRVEACVVPSQGFTAACGARAALALSAALRSGSGGVLDLSMRVYRAPEDAVGGGVLCDAYIESFYSFTTKYPAESAAYCAQYGVPSSVFKGLGARTLFAVLRFLRAADLLDDDAVICLTASGAIVGSDNASQVTLARYYRRTYGFQGVDFDVDAPDADERCLRASVAVQESWTVCEAVGMSATLKTVLAHEPSHDAATLHHGAPSPVPAGREEQKARKRRAWFW